jgi:hypothetical protein
LSRRFGPLLDGGSAPADGRAVRRPGIRWSDDVRRGDSAHIRRQAHAARVGRRRRLALHPGSARTRRERRRVARGTSDACSSSMAGAPELTGMRPVAPTASVVGVRLAIDFHDSDNATVDVRSASAAGRFYLGFQPRYSSAGGVADVQGRHRGRRRRLTERGPSCGDADARSVVQRSSSTNPMMMPSGPRT